MGQLPSAVGYAVSLFFLFNFFLQHGDKFILRHSTDIAFTTTAYIYSAFFHFLVANNQGVRNLLYLCFTNLITKFLIAGIKDYAERITHYMPFNITTIPELKNTKSLSEQQQKEREGELILKLLQPSDTVVLMDEHGQEFRSIEFAKWIERKQATARRLVFVIGGPYGFSQPVYDRANEKISLSKMTFSHQMVRLIFTEALYRACTIIKGEPYHHE